ncbi:MAG: peptidylprolyl isomerase [Anaerolineales bacterium]|nr:peptidylprolyl isomerase [Anaerolineales bacterium]
MANPKQRIVNRKHVARIERERQQTRMITIGAIAILSIVLVLVIIGVVNAYIITPNKSVAWVNDEPIKAREYQAQVRLERLFLVNQYYNYQQFAASFGDQSTQDLFASNLQQILVELTPDLLGQDVLDRFIEDKLIAEEAAERGISVSEAEIDARIASQYFNYFPDGTPTPTATQVAIPTSTLTPLQLELVPPTPSTALTETETITLELGTEPTPTAIPVEPEAAEPTAIPPTPTAYTADAYESNLKDGLSNLRTTGIPEDEFRAIIKRELLREKLFEMLTADTPRSEEQVWARHILVETEEEAKEVLNRYYAGEDFAALAQELSVDTGSGVEGGDLGWFGRGMMVSEFEEVAFGLEIGEVSLPIESEFGWHVIQVLGHEERPIAANRYNQLRSQAFNEWLETARAEAEIEIAEDWLDLVPTEPDVITQ